MTRSLLVILVVLAGAGCALLGRDASRALADADAHAAQGDYPAAMAAYDAYLARYPEDGGADRARAVLTLVKELMAARAERDALVTRESELTRQASEHARQTTAREAESTRQAAAREGELTRLRQELAARQGEVARLREDFEALKRTDLQMERRRR